MNLVTYEVWSVKLCVKPNVEIAEAESDWFDEKHTH